ncbi:hypothetical protein EBR43_02865 [bacterium]|nr:hypothetical protein [bacterium]
MSLIKNFFSFNENISDDKIDLSKKYHNIIFLERLPDYLYNIRDTSINYWNDTLEAFPYEKEEIDKSIPLLTTQKYLSKNFIDSLDDQTYKKSDIILVEDKHQNLWIMDGHHRLFFDRSKNKNSFAFIIPFDDIEEIEKIWY